MMARLSRRRPSTLRCQRHSVAATVPGLDHPGPQLQVAGGELDMVVGVEHIVRQAELVGHEDQCLGVQRPVQLGQRSGEQVGGRPDRCPCP